MDEDIFKDEKFPLKVKDFTNSEGFTMLEVIDQDGVHICYSHSIEKAIAIKDILNDKFK